ncbi:hypothetical protein CAPTEDRAFT_162875 [Capitella teleta]|uniref:Ribosomal protein S21 n=1 Tax=Capitella teleta TaxID=283909 RepID=R7U3I2_CAPTE|nr:hypothetical protein CAPTEDRAFT_162875 [Capitella teleta]|eukprot:ELU00524.1 hypothetical protein CAPTEDRAFT_162875 [Capitella teleta]
MVNGHKIYNFLARTVLVKNNEIEMSLKSLERVLGQEQLYIRAKRQMFYEKPCRKRQRIAFEHAKRVYDAEMTRKIEFVVRKNRVDPWLR